MRQRIETEKLERGYSGTAKSIQKMHELVAKAKLDPTVRKIALWIRMRVSQDKRSRSRALADAIFRWVEKHGIFSRDAFQVEQLEDPLSSMLPVIAARRNGAYQGPGIFTGDCDTFSMWMAALAGSLGFQYGFETIKVDPGRPDEFSHVYTVLRIGNQWVPFDPSSTGAKPGWRPPTSPEKRKVWSEPAIEEVVGMSGMNGTDGGMGLWKDEPGYYPEDWFYGIPTTQSYYFDPEEDGVLPPIDGVEPGTMELNVPPEAAMSRADLEQPADTGLRREPPPPASARPLMNDYGTYYPRPKYVGKPKHSVHVSDPYPPGWPWRMQVVRTGQLDPMRAPYAVGDGSGAAPGVVREYVAPQPITGMGEQTYLPHPTPAYGSYEDVMRRAVLEPPDRYPLPPGGLMSGLGQEAETVKKNTDTAIERIFKLIPAVGELVVDKKKAQYAERIGRATGTVAARKEASIWDAAGIPKPTALSAPVVVGGLAAIGILGYFVLPKLMPVRKRKRYRRPTRRRRRR